MVTISYNNSKNNNNNINNNNDDAINYDKTYTKMT